MKLNKKMRIFFLIVLLIAAGYLFYKYIFLSEQARIKKFETDYNHKLELINSSNLSDAKLEDLNRQIKEIENEKNSKLNKLSKPIVIPDFVSEISIAASTSKVDILGIKFEGNSSAVKGDIKEFADASNVLNKIQQIITKDDNNKNSIKTLITTIEFSGTYTNCIKFTKTFEGHSRLYVVDRVNVGIEEGICAGEIILNSYYFTAEDLAKVTPAPAKK